MSRKPHKLTFAVWMALLVFAGVCGCGRQSATAPDLSPTRVRQLATQYRDEWLAKHSVEDVSILKRSTIIAVKRHSAGWQVTFVTPTGHGPATPEGRHDYFLHIYLKRSGALDRVVRGPDLLS